MSAGMSPALLTDKYELTMLAAALRDGTAHRRTTFEVFARRLPEGRRYGVVAGTARFVEALAQFTFDDAALSALSDFCDRETLAYLADYRFRGDVDGYAEGELYFPGSPVLAVHGTFGECVVLETLALSILNHDTAIASAAARMAHAAEGRPLIEMGSRRTHERAAVAAARAAYIAGFTGSSNLEAQRTYGVPALGTSAHAFTLLHTTASGPGDEPLGRRTSEWEKAAFKAQIDALGVGTTLLVDTYDITAGVANAVEVAGPELGAVRIDSGDLGVLARQVRDQLDGLGATRTRIVVSGDLDEFAIAALRAEPVDIYGVGTSVVTGSGAPTASMVYKLVEVDGIPVEKRSSRKESHGGRKQAHARREVHRHHRRGGRVSLRRQPVGAAGHDRTATDGHAGPRGRAGRRPRTRRRAGSREGGAGKLAVGRPQAFARGTGDPHPHDLPRETLGAATGETGNVTELLARAVTALGGSERHGQIEMAEAVAHAFDSGEHLAVQAGTGTGKSLAYLVPAIARAVETDEPVVVSTATIALQRQLVNRDLPRLAESLADVLPRSPEFALLKGRGNYLCLNKIHNGSASEPDEQSAGGALRAGRCICARP